MTLVAQEVKHWKSYDTVADVSIKGQPETIQGQKQDIQSSQQGIIAEYIQNLSNLYHHDNKLVRKILSYLLASKDGLSEAEILSIIAQDQYFINSVATDQFHQKESTELPMAIWARLSMMLRPFLSQKKQDGETLLYFFHREFEDVIKQSPEIRQEHEALIEATQKLIKENQDNPFDANRWGKLYTTLVTQYDLAYQDEIKLAEYANFISKLTNADWIKSIQMLIRDIGEYKEQENEILESFSLFKFLNNICSILYQDDNREWVEEYVKSINNLSSLYDRLNRDSDARRNIELSLKICEPLYKKDSNRWAKLYVSALSYKSGELSRDADVEDMGGGPSYSLVLWLKIVKQIFNIIKPLYALNTDYWKEYYVISSVHYADATCSSDNYHQEDSGCYKKSISIVERAIKILENDTYLDIYNRKDLYIWASNICGDIHFRVGEPDQSLLMYKKSLEETKKLCKINPSRWLPQYRLTLENIASLYKLNGQIEPAIELILESIKISEDLFETNQELWADVYLSSLSMLTDVYKSTSETARETTVRKKYFAILETCYKHNSFHYERDYLTGIDELVSHYISIKDNSSLLEMLKYNLNITRKLYESRAHDYFAQRYFAVLEIFSDFLLNAKEISQALDLKWIQLEVKRSIVDHSVNATFSSRGLRSSPEREEEMREDNKRTVNYDYFNYLKGLGETFLNCGKPDTAKNLFTEAYEIIKDIQLNYQCLGMYDDDITDIRNKLNIVNSQESM